MSIVATSVKITAGYEPITGYTLEEKIGQGGFGEVWRADAPGGLKKAVKFVFGATDAHRGSRELKSLERIKGVHHPFLLTLERFGIVDDQLVIVTELADGSLEDIYDRHRERGSCGIPRKALLAYLHDAADALDYLHSQYQLQHLDIKPGNLLLVGGHVKVGDFGLLKDLRDTDCSVVGGLTPTYAPPEVFDGRPSMQSDQYSLAVMYQERLTGTRPFNRRTIAQLATQHVHSAPNLEPLPAADRPILARALEKNPDRRYGNCADFVDALREVHSRSAQVGGHRTISGGGGDTLKTSHLVKTGDDKPAIEDLPQLDSSAACVSSRATGHTLVVALGGAGAECLHELRDRVAKLHTASPVDLHSVLIDTDMDSIHAIRLAEISDRIPQCHTIYAPLKSPSDYREEQHERFRTVSRRWIYNVPRSGRTEGMRPLGRLAMVDHGHEIRATLIAAIDHLAAVSGDRTPHIYIVGSIAGGSGSGMFLDIVHLMRSLLDDAGLQQTKILSLMAAAPLQGNPRNPLELHDTLATLTEMRYFLRPGNGYPGDAGAGFPSVPAARTPLHETYIVSGGSSTQHHVRPIETIIDYLWADSTGATELLASARKENGGDEKASSKPAFVRSVGVARLGCLRALEENLLTPALVRHLLFRWLGRPAEARQIAKPLCERLIKRCEITAEIFQEAFLQSVAENADARRQFVAKQLRRLPAAAWDDREGLDRYLDSAIGDALNSSVVHRQVVTAVVSLHRELTVRLHDRRLDLTSAIEAVRLLVGHCEAIGARLTAEHESKAADDTPGPAAATDVGGGDPLQVACDHAVERLVAHADMLVVQGLKNLVKRLEDLIERLENQAAMIAHAIQLTTTESCADQNAWTEMPPEIQVRFEPLMINLHTAVAKDALLFPFQQEKPPWSGQDYVDHLNGHAMPLVEDAVDAADQGNRQSQDSMNASHSAPTRGLDTESLSCTRTRQGAEMRVTQTLSMTGDSIGHGTAQRWNEQNTIESALRAVRPSLLDCGGRQRLLLLVGNEAERRQLEQKTRDAHGGALTVVLIPGITPMLIHEAQQIRLDDVIGRLNMVAGGDRSVSSRLHCRADIDWAGNTAHSSL